MLSQQIMYSVEEVEQMVAGAYQSGINYGYMMAVKEDMLELEAMKREQEREAIINWQGHCESREGDECGHDFLRRSNSMRVHMLCASCYHRFDQCDSIMPWLQGGINAPSVAATSQRRCGVQRQYL